MEILLLSNQTKSMTSDKQITSAVLTYHTRDVDPEQYTDEQVLSLVLDKAPETIGSAVVENAEIVEYHGSGVYEIEVRYEQRAVSSGSVMLSARRSGDERWSISASHTIEHVLHGRETAAFGPNAPEVGNLINWNGRQGAACVVSGADIISTTVRENCIKTMKASDFTTAFRKRIANLSGCINSKAFHGWSTGEVLFLGANSGMPYINNLKDELIDVTFQFAIRRNPGARNVNGRVISSGGWDVVWPLGTRNVFVSSIYPRDDLNMLGVGK